MLCNIRPFGEHVKCKEDSVYYASVASSECDSDCEIFLAITMTALIKYVENKLKDFLPDSFYSQPSEHMKTKLRVLKNTSLVNVYTLITCSDTNHI